MATSEAVFAPRGGDLAGKVDELVTSRRNDDELARELEMLIREHKQGQRRRDNDDPNDPDHVRHRWRAAGVEGMELAPDSPNS